ncbi:hypothetical protein QBC38DRAFT_488750 [Podospora fimiseda]|uniref:Uncharacterized protein n=1 Tax=Podospora fimiseda TaxID=252190 RepID=A0AAN6YS33_9PEZI|nr:hypothetical protein QBC38DRAFT_488750 [Podospora fimiseda]
MASRRQHQNLEDIRVPGHHTRTSNNNWDEAVPRILGLLDRLEAANAHFGGIIWQYDWDRRDMHEEIQVMRHLLREGIINLKSPSFVSVSTIPKVLDALDKEIILDLEEALRLERAKNWELSYYARDLEEDKWRLEVMMRDMRLEPSLGSKNAMFSNLVPKTALEKALEMEVAELKETIRNPMAKWEAKQKWHPEEGKKLNRRRRNSL